MKPRRWILLGTFVVALVLWVSHERAERTPSQSRATFEVAPDLRAALEAGGFESPERVDLVGRVERGGAAAPAVMVAASGPGVSGFTWTDSAGEFRLEGLAPGEVELLLVAPQAPNLATTVEVGGEVPLVLQLPPQLPDVPMIAEVERADFRGRVEPTFDDSPAAMVVLCVPDVGLSGLPDFAAALEGRFLRSALCDESGEFTFADLALGAYRVVVLPPWAEGSTWPALIERNIEHRADLEPLVLRCQSGRLAGTLREVGGEPVSGVRVELRDATRPERLWPPAISGPDGGFLVRHLPEGTYRVSFTTGQAERERTVRVSALRATEVEFEDLDLFVPAED